MENPEERPFALPRRLGDARRGEHHRREKAQPAIPEIKTDRTIPRGTISLAPTVSSEAWAEASNPVIV